MKKILLSLAVACVAIAATATQTFAQSKPTVGIKAGVGFYTLGTALYEGSTISYDMKPGFQGGVTLNLPVSNALSFEPQLLYSEKGGKGKTRYLGYDVEVTTGIDYLDLPLLMKYNVGKAFSFYGGPQVSFLLSQATTVFVPGIGGTGGNSTDGFRKVQIGGNFGVGYKLHKDLGVNLHYAIDLSHVATGKADDGERNSGLALTLGYSF